MAVFNYLRKEIDAKLVYYGPGLCGKTTNLQYIHEHLKQEQRGKMVSLATDEDRTLFFDFLPVELGNVRGFKTRFHIYTVPGQVYYGATRRAVLTGADGVIFVADSQADRMDDNILSLKDLEENLRYYGKRLEATPFVIQYNKRDMPNILTVEELNQKLNRQNVPHFEAVAPTGKGVFETLTMISRAVLKAIESGVEARKSAGTPESAPEAGTAKPPRVEPSIPRPEPPRTAAEAPYLKLPKKDLDIPRPDLRLPKKDLNIPHPQAPGAMVEGAQVKAAPRVDKGILRPEPPRGGLEVGPAKEFRLERDVSRPEAARTIPGMGPAKGLRPERDIGRPEAIRTIPETGPARGVRLEREGSAPEHPRPGRIPPISGPKPAQEAISPGGRAILSHLLEKKKPGPSLGAEEENGKKISGGRERLRIVSCGQPRVSSPNSLEIPLTLEIEGTERSLSFNLAIKLEQFEPKVH